MSKRLILAGMLLATVAMGSAIKTWSTSERITATDLNANFSHLHANLGHGHGAIVVNADIASAAAIAHSKLATPALVPKAWAAVPTSCTGVTAPTAGVCTTGPCTVAVSSGVANIGADGATGRYRVCLSSNPSDTSFAVLVTPATGSRACTVGSLSITAPHAIITCTDLATPTAADTGFMVLVLDNT